MKKMSKFAVVLLMLTAMVLAAVACNKPTQVVVEQDNMPRLTFVQGQDLDFSNGQLTVRYENELVHVPLDSSEVKISGYDKNKLGIQELTISYKGVSTKLNITVVPRIQVSGETKNYFVGESFDNTGTLIITADDGVSYNVAFTDSKVTVEGFSSEVEALDLPITVRYVDQDNDINYSGSFTVNINAVDEIDFKGPNITAYKNYEELNLDGGYFTLKAKPERNASPKHVYITSDMVSGYDPSVVTPENIDTPVTQTITVSFMGQTWTFKVNIRYSYVSVIRPIAQELIEIDWTVEDPEISSELGDKALEAMELYLGLNGSERSALTIQEKAAIARTVAIHGYKEYLNELDSFSDVFVIRDKYYFNKPSYAQTKAALERLQNDDDNLYYVSNLLSQTLNTFSEIVIKDEVTIGAFLEGFFDPSDPLTGFKEFIPGVLELMISLYDSLKDVPSSWTPATVGNYANEIEQAFNIITTSPYRNNRIAFGIVESWRGDLFDIIYWHLYNEEDIDSLVKIYTWYLPSKIEKVYSSIVSARNNINYYDRSFFIYYYSNAIKYENELFDSQDEMSIVLYNSFGFHGFFQDDQGNSVPVSLSYLLWYLRTGYTSYLGTLYGYTPHHLFWDNYISVLEKYYFEAGYFGSTEYEEDVVDLFTAFVEMSPMEQLGFLQSVFEYYPQYNVFDLSQGMYLTAFSEIVINYYGSKLSQNAFMVFYKLINAYEYYIQHLRGMDKEARFNAFTSIMDEVEGDYTLLTVEEKEAFNEHLGFFYEKMLDIYTKYGDKTNITPTELGEWADKFEQLNKVLYDAESTLSQILDNKIPLFMALVTAFQQAEALVADILENAPAEIIEAFYHEPIFLDAYSLQCIWYEVRYFSMQILHSVQITLVDSVYLAIDLYSVPVQEFLEMAAYPIWTSLQYDDELEKNFDEEKMLAIMAAFRNLETWERAAILLGIDGSLGNYHYAIGLFFTEVLPEDSKLLELANELIAFEKLYLLFGYIPNGKFEDGTTYLEALKASMAKIESLKEGLTEEDQAAFDKYLKGMYEYYVAAYDELELDEEDGDDGEE